MTILHKLKIFGIRNKLLLLLCVGLLGFVSACVIIIALYNMRFVDQQTRNVSQAVNQTCTNVEYFLSRYNTICSKLSYNKTLTQVLDPNLQYSDPYQIYLAYKNELDTVIGNALQEDLEINIRVYFYNQTFFQDYRTFFKADRNKLPNEICQKAQDHNGNILWTADGKTVSVSKLLRTSSFDDIGVCTLSFDEKQLYSFMEESLPEERLIAIVDEEYRVVSSNERGLVGELLSNQPYYSDLINLSGREAYDYNSSGLSAKLMKQPILVNGQAIGWSMITVIPLTKFYQESERLRAIAIAVCLLSVGLTVLAFARATKGPLARIEALTEGMKEVQNQRFPIINNLDTNDEIGLMTTRFNQMSETINHLINENYLVNIHVKDLAIRNSEAELYALQSQLNPHFLFNTLESIRMNLLKKNSEAAQQMLLNLSKLLRTSLREKRDIVTLADELTFVESYAAIQKQRFHERLMLTCNVEAGLYSCTVPKFILQPLVENSINHGIEGSEHGGLVEILGCMQSERLVLTVRDNGVGIDSEQLAQIQQSLSSGEGTRGYQNIGLCNIHDRIVMTYGREYGLAIDSVRQQGTCVTLTLPLRWPNGEEQSCFK